MAPGRDPRSFDDGAFATTRCGSRRTTTRRSFRTRVATRRSIDASTNQRRRIVRSNASTCVDRTDARRPAIATRGDAMRDAVYYPDDDDDAREDAREDGATTTTRAGATTTTTTTTTIATGDASEGDGKARATIATGAREGGGSYTTPGVVPPVMPTRLVSARTYESEPARGTPVSAIETRPRPQTIARAQGGVFAFVSPMFADMDDPQVRAVMEREFARELGLPEGELPVDLEHFMLARQLSRVVRLFALIDMVLCVLYALSGVSVIAVLLIGPLAGFVGARMYSPGLTACYVAFCVASIVWRILNFVFMKNVTARVLSVITIILATYITRLVIRFYHVVRVIPLEGQILLRQLDFANSAAPVV